MGSSMLAASDARAARRWLSLHATVIGLEVCGALLLAAAAWRQNTPATPPCVADALLPWPEWSDAAANATLGRRLVASDLSPEFSRRLAFHNWVEHDVALDRAGLARYLAEARVAAGLPAARDGAAAARRPASLSVEALEARLRDGGFPFDAAFAAQAHHLMSGGAPWSRGRDEFMLMVRHGLRPPHYLLEVGCGALTTGQHVARYLLTGRYYCIESDEFLLRAAVEYEVPAAGLIYKRPRFMLSENVDVARLLAAPVPWLSEPPTHFDFAVALQTDAARLDAAVTSIVRYLRPRTGRLIVATALPAELQAKLGLRELNDEGSPDAAAATRAACPFSTTCTFRVYST